MIGKISLIFVNVCIFSSICMAQEFPVSSPEYPPGNPFTRVLDVYSQSGQLQNWTVTQDQNGLLYVGTNNGLMLYDGVRWNQIHVPNGYVISLGVDSEGTVFVGGDGELGYLAQANQDESFTFVSLKEKLPAAMVEDMFSEVWQTVPSDDGVYFRAGRYMLLWTGEEFRYWETNSDFRHITHHRNEIVVRIRDEGVYRVNEEFELEKISFFDGLEDFQIIGFHEIDENTDLIVTRDQGLSRVTRDRFEKIESEASDFLEENSVYKSILLFDGSVVVGTLNAGLIHINSNGEILSQLDSGSGLPEDRVYDLYVDRDGSLWVTHDRNVTKVDFHFPMRKYDHRNGLRGTVMEMVVHDDEIFVATSHGVFRMSGFVGHFEEMHHELESCFGIENYEDKIIAGCLNGIFVFNNGDTTEIETPSGLRIRLLKRSGFVEEWVYAGTEDGMQIIDMNDYTMTATIPGISSFPLSIEEYKGVVWVGLNDGNILAYSKEQLENWVQNENREIQPKKYKIDRNDDTDNLAIHIFPFQDRLLFSTNRNIYKFDDETDRLVADHPFGEEFNNRGQLFRFHEDQNGNAWMRYGNRKLVAWKENNGSFKISNALLNRIVDSQVYTIQTDNHNTVWFGGSEGLHRYYYDVMREYQPSASAFIRQVYIGTDSLIVNFPDLNGRDLNPITLDYAHNELRFTYTLTSFDNPEGIHFRYKLENFDDDWSDWTTETQKDYTNLPEGSYTFTLHGRDTYGNSYEAAGFTFTILPPLYRTWWAYLLYLITASGILYTAHKIRVNRILEVQKVRNRIASDLHDEISATLSSISFFAEAIRQRKEPNEEKEKRFIELISKSAGEAKENMSDIIWSINPENDDWKVLLAKCRRFASDMLESRGIQYELDIAEDIPKNINIELRQHIWLIFKEMVTNAARHSDASKVHVTLKYADNAVRMEVADNGTGFNPEEIDAGNGLKNIKRRAEKIGAQINITSGSEGTIWRLLKRF